MKTFFIASKKCPRRYLDAGRLYEYFIANGLKPTSEKEADLIVIYTCGGFNDWEQKSLRAIRQYKKEKGRVIVSGCLHKICPDAINELEVQVLSHTQMHRLDKMIDAKVKFKDVPKVSKVRGVKVLETKTKWHRRLSEFELSLTYVKQILKRKFKTQQEPAYQLEIARGCLGNCTYCAIKLAMGKLRSRAIEDILTEFKQGLKTHDRFELIAGDIGCYGIDKKTTFPKLLKALLSVPSDFRLVLTDITPRFFIRYEKQLIPLLVKYQEKVETIMIPVQSGSNKVLKSMNRQYDIKKVRQALIRLKKEAPLIKLETHLLVGFPGETERDFQQSINFIEQVGFDRYFFYSYDDRPRTKAYDMKPKVAEHVKKKRIKRLKKYL